MISHIKMNALNESWGNIYDRRSVNLSESINNLIKKIEKEFSIWEPLLGERSDISNCYGYLSSADKLIRLKERRIFKRNLIIKMLIKKLVLFHFLFNSQQVLKVGRFFSFHLLLKINQEKQTKIVDEHCVNIDTKASLKLNIHYKDKGAMSWLQVFA